MPMEQRQKVLHFVRYQRDPEVRERLNLPMSLADLRRWARAAGFTKAAN